MGTLTKNRPNEDVMKTTLNELVKKMSLDEKIKQLHGISFYDCEDNERLDIAGFKVCDGPHGVRNESGGGPATAFPVGIAMTATWDTDIIKKVGWAMGREFQGYGKNTILGPSCDIARDPRNGRTPESGGEDPFLSGKINASLIRGIQSTKAVATIKHYIANNHQENRRNDDHTIGERDLREFYGLPFRMAVQEADVWSVMCCYNWINGKPGSENHDTLTQMLRNEWGFQYFVMSDWWSTYSNAANLLHAGLDLEMPEDQRYPNGLKTALENKEVSIDDIDKAVKRCLLAKQRAGLLAISDNYGNPDHINCEEHRSINIEAARKSIVLLKNEDAILPLSKSTQSIAIIGPNANRLVLDGFGSSKVDPSYTVTPLEGITEIAAKSEITFSQGCGLNDTDKSGFDEAVKTAADADYVVFIGGLDETQEGEGYGPRAGKDRENKSVQLPAIQQELINELASVNKKIIVIIQSGGICSVSDSISNIKGLIYGWYCGNEGGRAIAEVLFGDYNPGGKLPLTMPASDDQLPKWDKLDFTNDLVNGVGYRRFDAQKMKPLFAFGHGLSYTQFEYSEFRIDYSGLGDETLSASVSITNTGTLAGDEVVQLYLSSPDTSVAMPEKQLKGFKRIQLLPGESKEVTITLSPYELAYWDENRKHFFVEQGNYTLRVGGSSDKLLLSADFSVLNEHIIPHAQEESSIQILHPSGREFLKGTQEIRWQHTSTTEENPSVTVSFWKNGSWQVLDSNNRDCCFNWNTQDIDDTPGRIRVEYTQDNKTVSATSGLFFVKNNISSADNEDVSYKLETSVVGNGSVQTVGALFSCGSTANLRALPADGWRFIAWNGDLFDENPNATVMMDSDKKITAIFRKIQG